MSIRDSQTRGRVVKQTDQTSLTRCLMVAFFVGQLVLLPMIQAAPGDENWDDQFGITGLDGEVLITVSDGAGTVYVGGSFRYADGIGVNNIAQWNGSSWLPLGTGMNDSVRSLTLDSSGNLYAGGDFTTAGGVSANHIAKWDGNSWSALKLEIDRSISALAFDGSGNLYAGGGFITAEGVSANGIAKWDGSSWSALGSGIEGYVNSLAFDNSGNLYVAGSFRTAGGVSANHIAKWDGSSWSALGSGMNQFVSSLALDNSGNLYAGGGFSTVGGVSANRIAKWDGSRWSALGLGMNQHVASLVLDISGNLYAGGEFTTAGGVNANHIARWDGSSWSALGAGITTTIFSTVESLAFDSSGNLYAGGGFTLAGGVSANNIARWDGSRWSNLSDTMSNVFNGLSGGVTAIVSDADGSLYVGGGFTTAGGVVANQIAKWNGSSWSALGSGTNRPVLSLALDSAGHLYAGGRFRTAGGVNANYIAKWDGSNWSPLGSGMDSDVESLAFDSVGNLYAGGHFFTAGGVSVNGIAKWDGSNWSALGAGTDRTVYSLALDSNDALYASGNFTTAGVVSANRIAKWDGSSWFALDTGMNGNVRSLALDSSGNLYAGGGFTTAGGVSADGIAKWDGNSWSEFSSEISGSFSSLVLDGSDNLYASGFFGIAGGVRGNNIAKWDGVSWSALGSEMNGGVGALTLDSGGNLYAGGGFSTAGSKPSSRIARWTPAPVPMSDSAPTTPADFRFLVYSETAAEIFWNRSSDDGFVQGYEVTRNGESLGIRDALSVFEDDLNPGVDYHYAVTAIDNVGNSSATARISFSTDGNHPSTGTGPSIPGNLRYLVYSNTAADVFWDRSTDNGYVVGYEIIRNGELLGIRDTLGVFEDELVPGVTYLYAVTAIDDDGNRSGTSTIRLRTDDDQLPGGDDPAAPTGFQAKVYSATAAELFWNRPATFGLMYEIIRDGQVVDETDGVSYFDNTLSSGPTYQYEIVAIDLAGNRSAAATITVNTDPAIPTINRNNYHDILVEALDIYFAGSFDELLTKSLNTIWPATGPGNGPFPLTRNCSNGGTAIFNSSPFGIQLSDCLIEDLIHDGAYSILLGINGLSSGGLSLTMEPDTEFIFSGRWTDASYFYWLLNVDIRSSSPEGEFILENAEFSFEFCHLSRATCGGFGVDLNGGFTFQSSRTDNQAVTATASLSYREPWDTHMAGWNFRTGDLRLVAEDGSQLVLDADTGDDETISIVLTSNGASEEIIGPWPIRLERER